MKENEVIAEIGQQLGLTETSNNSVKIELLAEKINELLTHDFQKLISILYRMDVSENKLRKLLVENQNMDAGLIIANLMVERHIQKLKSREHYRQENNENETEEKW